MSIVRGGFVTSVQLHKLSNGLSGYLRPTYSSFCSRNIATKATYFKLGLGQRAPLKYTSDESRMSASSSSLGSDVRDGGVGASHEDLRQQKTAMRKRIGGVLKSMEKTRIGEASAAITERLLATPEMKAAHAVSIFLSMPREVGTSGMLSELFRSDKKVYIPKVTGSSSEDMRMFPLESEAEVSSFPLSKWKIPEPANETVQAREDGVYAGDLDLIVVPGMAFDSRCNRLGHGKGYYDCFFQRVDKSNAEKGHPPPVKMGVCFDEQIVETVPTSPSDVPLDFVLTPSRIFKHSPDNPR